MAPEKRIEEYLSRAAWSYMQKGRLDHAMAEYKTALRIDVDDLVAEQVAALSADPENAWAHIILATVYAHQVRLCDAAVEYEAALRLDPDNAEAHHWLGRVYEEQGRLTEAFAEYGAMLRLEPDSAKLYAEQAPASGRLRPEYGADCDSEDAETCCGLGWAWERQRQWGWAALWYKRALCTDPNYTAAREGLKRAAVGRRKAELTERDRLWGLGYYNIAWSLLAVTESDELVWEHLALGSFYLQQGWLDAALAEYEAALNTDSEDHEARCGLGQVYEKQGRLEDAIAEYEMALRLEGHHYLEPHAGLGRIYEKQGRLEDAVAEHEKALTISTKHLEYDASRNSRCHHSLGRVCEKQGRLDEAIAQYEAAARYIGPWEPEYAQYHNSLEA